MSPVPSDYVSPHGAIVPQNTISVVPSVYGPPHDAIVTQKSLSVFPSICGSLHCAIVPYNTISVVPSDYGSKHGAIDTQNKMSLVSSDYNSPHGAVLTQNSIFVLSSIFTLPHYAIVTQNSVSVLQGTIVYHIVKQSLKIRQLQCQVTMVHRIKQPLEIKGFDIFLQKYVPLCRTTSVEPGCLLRVLQVRMIEAQFAGCGVTTAISRMTTLSYSAPTESGRAYTQMFFRSVCVSMDLLDQRWVSCYLVMKYTDYFLNFDSPL